MVSAWNMQRGGDLRLEGVGLSRNALAECAQCMAACTVHGSVVQWGRGWRRLGSSVTHTLQCRWAHLHCLTTTLQHCAETRDGPAAPMRLLRLR